MSRVNRTVIYLAMSAFCIIWIYPFLWMVSASFKTQEAFFSNGLSLFVEQFTLENLVRAWNEAHFGQYFINSVLITLGTVVIVVFTTATCGYVLGRYAFKGKKLVYALLISSMFVPMEFTIIPIYELIKMMGLVNTRFGVILAEAGGNHIIFILLFAAFFAKVPKELEEAAIMDGCSFFRTFFTVMLPLSKPVMASVVIMQFIWSWNSFLLPLVLTLNAPDARPLSVGLYSLRGENIVDWTGIAAGGTIAIVPIIVIFLTLQRYFVDGISGSVKG